MSNVIAAVDTRLAAWLSPLPRIALWGMASAAFGMGCYALACPRQKLVALRQQQKVARENLRRHDGDWPELRSLIARDLRLALRQIGLLLLPVTLSAAPLVAVMMALSGLFGEAAYVGFGPEWMRGFEFWYAAAALACSAIIKLSFRIT